jgi:hypothetical protein
MLACRTLSLCLSLPLSLCCGLHGHPVSHIIVSWCFQCAQCAKVVGTAKAAEERVRQQAAKGMKELEDITRAKSEEKRHLAL